MTSFYVEADVLIKPTASVITETARITAPTQISPTAPLGSVAACGSIEKKNPADMKIAERGTPIRTNQTSGEGRTAESASI